MHDIVDGMTNRTAIGNIFGRKRRRKEETQQPETQQPRQSRAKKIIVPENGEVIKPEEMQLTEYEREAAAREKEKNGPVIKHRKNPYIPLLKLVSDWRGENFIFTGQINAPTRNESELADLVLKAEEKLKHFQPDPDSICRDVIYLQEAMEKEEIREDYKRALNHGVKYLENKLWEIKGEHFYNK